ncbi:MULTISPECIES: YqaJ viral recombinase family nuclease [Thiorhodovibrio]|uniref:YqaJ viral recombinase family nuclease n=1 Tax=Thiorhodovibrio TaxID=61593 RepID=UPI001912E89D|nr:MULTISPECIES: YqaJ viral recombinase family protein [Thiorhodovibrio]MBK5968811.1 endonuclease [Thiorhodovibrio winogradskyi]WPL12229.1 putative phage-type endonuclease [Thiorhodovibrio litoralis]
MKTIDLAQRTPEWHQWRAQGITASESAIILGRSPYKTPWRLWAERTGLAKTADLSKNPLVQRGNRLEDAARQWFEQRYDTLVLPVCGESEEEPLLRASFDGITDAGEPVELKVPSERTLRDVAEHGRAASAFRLYEPQVQHQLYVAGADKGYLVFYQEDNDPIVFEITRDPALITSIVTQGKAFWRALVEEREPEKDPQRDLFIPKGPQADDWAVLAGRYRALQQEAKTVEAELKRKKAALDDIQTTLVAMMGQTLIAESAGLRVTRFCAKGSVDYPALLQARLPELGRDAIEAFRRQPSERVRVTVQEPPATTVIPLKPKANREPAHQATDDHGFAVATSFWF